MLRDFPRAADAGILRVHQTARLFTVPASAVLAGIIAAAWQRNLAISRYGLLAG
jgi:hypothetical protein